MKNKIILFSCLAAALLVSGCYPLKQAKGQLEIYFKQVPLSEAAVKESNPEFRSLLKAVPEIKEFAVKRLLLKKTDGYSDYFATSKEGITFVVTAAPKNELKAYTWSFPFLGAVPYKGFFEKQDAAALEKELRDKGYDTRMFPAVAYSTLGWLKDPVTTPMLRHGLFFMAQTIIHEMTHAKFYVKGRGEFNEQLASFVGQKGAFQYFAENKALDEEQLEQIRGRLAKSSQTARIVRRYVPELENLYSQRLPPPTTLKKREIIFSQITGEILKIYPQSAPKYWRFNNARILQYKRYKTQNVIFRDLWKRSGGNWGVFWKLIKRLADKNEWSIVSY